MDQPEMIHLVAIMPPSAFIISMSEVSSTPGSSAWPPRAVLRVLVDRAEVGRAAVAPLLQPGERLATPWTYLRHPEDLGHA